MAGCPDSPGAIVAELANFLPAREVLGWSCSPSMLVFSSLAFTVLENAMSVIFHHRVVIRRAALPGLGRHSLPLHPEPRARLLFVTLVAGSLQAMGEHQVDFLWRPGRWAAFPASLL